MKRKKYIPSPEVRKNIERYKNKYNKENYEMIKLMVRPGLKAMIKKIASEKGKSMTQYIVEAVAERIKTEEIIQTGKDEQGWD